MGRLDEIDTIRKKIAEVKSEERRALLLDDYEKRDQCQAERRQLEKRLNRIFDEQAKSKSNR